MAITNQSKTQQKSFKSTSLHYSFQLEIGNILSDFNWQFCKLEQEEHQVKCVHAHSSSMFATEAAELKYSCKMNKESENTHSKKSNKRKKQNNFFVFCLPQKAKEMTKCSCCKKICNLQNWYTLYCCLDKGSHSTGM